VSTLQRIGLDDVDWAQLDAYPDRTVFQTRDWLKFVTATQGASPVLARVCTDDGHPVGYFTGLIVRSFGARILGSPFPGWSTAYMGFNLQPGIARESLLADLRRFAFGELGCVHLEVMDRLVVPEAALPPCFRRDVLNGYEIDLTRPDRDLFAAMTPACRRCIRAAERSGLSVEEAHDAAFIDDYYSQLQEVFGRQGLVPTYPKERVTSLLRYLLPTGNLLLLRVRTADGRCIATGIFPAMNRMAYFWGGASWRASQQMRPNELMHWYAMRYWQARGVARYDMGGGGAYKAKYGGKAITIPWLRTSRFVAIEQMRSHASRLIALRQRLLGRRGASALEPGIGGPRLRPAGAAADRTSV
jgi:CelD/BcsL family acetyltransferase involved in cellulose biosynthesis